MRFYLGTHEESWLDHLGVPLFISHRRLLRRTRLPRACAPWALDSGGFSELSLYGTWRTTEEDYISAVRQYADQIGRLEWAAPMDWMCEPVMLEKTGLTIRDHQLRTVLNFLSLRSRAPELPFVPVLQGWTPADYMRCWELYDSHGIRLEDEPLVGVGTVCRRQGGKEAARIFNNLHPLRMHGFGVKMTGLRHYRESLVSCDSMAWSFAARRSDPLPGCTHKACNNCAKFALRWYHQLQGEQQTLMEA